jgi:hypothetical protein
MDNIKSHIVEEFFDYARSAIGGGWTFYLYKNPYQDEIRKYIPREEARGFIDVDGNLYLEGFDGYERENGPMIGRVLHIDIIYALKEKGVIRSKSSDADIAVGLGSESTGVCIFLLDKKKVYLSDSISMKYLSVEVRNYFEKCAQKNPTFEFNFNIVNI